MLIYMSCFCLMWPSMKTVLGNLWVVRLQMYIIYPRSILVLVVCVIVGRASLPPGKQFLTTRKPPINFCFKELQHSDPCKIYKQCDFLFLQSPLMMLNFFNSVCFGKNVTFEVSVLLRHRSLLRNMTFYQLHHMVQGIELYKSYLLNEFCQMLFD